MEKIIEVDLTSNENFYEKYNQKEVSIDLVNYLISSTPKLLRKDKIKIVINNKTEEKNIENLIKSALKKEYNNSLQEHYHTNVVQFLYLLIGLLVLFLSTLIIEAILKEVILIGGWVFIWALVELEIFNDARGRHRRIILKKLINSDIVEIKK